jgi:hypothetical protein
MTNNTPRRRYRIIVRDNYHYQDHDAEYEKRRVPKRRPKPLIGARRSSMKACWKLRYRG